MININAEILTLLRQHAGAAADYQNVTVQADGLAVTHELQSLADLAFTDNGLEIDCGEDGDRIRISNSAAQSVDIFEDNQKTTCTIKADAWTAVLTFAWLTQNCQKGVI